MSDSIQTRSYIEEHKFNCTDVRGKESYNHRILRFDSAKTILMFLVLIQHCFFSYFITYDFRDLSEAFRFLCLGCTMPLFSFLSGWFMCKPASISDILRLGFLCVCFNICGNVLARGAGVRASWIPLALAPSLWYLWVLMISRIIVPVFSKIPGSLLISFLTSWLVCFLPHHYGIALLGRFFGFFPFFMLGCVVGNDFRFTKIRSMLMVQKSGGIGTILLLAVLYLAGFLFTAYGVNYRLVHDGLGHMTFGRGLLAVANRILF